MVLGCRLVSQTIVLLLILTAFLNILGNDVREMPLAYLFLARHF